jgi:glycosyltransferase involved in cell wall biosynthesis
MSEAAVCRLRLLFLLPFPPRGDARDGGGRAMAQLLMGLAAHHDVALLCLRAPHEPATDPRLAALCRYVEEVHGAASSSTGWRGRGQLARALLRGEPIWVRSAAVPLFARRVRELADDWRPDVITIQYHVMAQYLPALDGCQAPRVLTQYEPGTAAARDLWRSGQGQGRFVAYLDMLAWKRYERRIMRQVQVVVALTRRDQDALAQLNGRTAIACIPLGTEIPARALDPRGEVPPSLTFVGNFAHPPNVDAATRLIDSILPRIWARFPDLTLYVVGEHPPAPLQRRAGPHVQVTGQVPDVSPYLDRAAVVPVPLRFGGGMRVKVLEALAAGKAVVASSLAVEGLDVVHGQQVLLAETDEQFGAAIVQLLADPEWRVQLAEQARAWACANLHWDSHVRAYEDLYRHLLSGSASGARIHG